LLRRLTGAHQFLAAHMFYPLLLCTVVAGGFFVVRVALRGEIGFAFLVKNLFLAWVPYFFGLAAVWLHEHRPRARIRIAATWGAWLAMFPNAPYIFTDLIHWRYRREMPWWFDLGLCLMFSLAGFVLALASLRIMHELVRRRVGLVGGWIFVVVVVFLSGFGIFLGRFLRWNSWDLLTHPHVILGQTLRGLLDPLAHTQAIGVTLMFGTMLLAVYVMFASARSDPYPATAKDAVDHSAGPNWQRSPVRASSRLP